MSLAKRMLDQYGGPPVLTDDEILRLALRHKIRTDALRRVNPDLYDGVSTPQPIKLPPHLEEKYKPLHPQWFDNTLLPASLWVKIPESYIKVKVDPPECEMPPFAPDSFLGYFLRKFG